MAGMIVAVFCFSLLGVTNGVTITGPSSERLVVEYGDDIALFCNYTLQSGETGTVGTSATLSLNGSTVANIVYSYNEAGGSGQNSVLNPFLNYFLTRTEDIQELRHNNSIGIRIRNIKWTDSGNYTWNLIIDNNNAGIVTKTNEVIVGEKPGSASLVSSHVGGMVYTLNCTVTGGFPSPNITILNGTEVINSSSTSPTIINVTVEFTTVFYCVGSNVLGSTNDSRTLLEPTTTMSPTTSTVTTTGDNTAFTTTKPPDKNQTRDNTGQTPTTAKALDPDNPPNVALIVGVICGCVGGFCIIVILVCVFKKKLPRTNPGEKELTLEDRVVEGNDNTYALDENSTKLATEQEQEKKQQKDVKDRQHDQGPRGNTKPAGRDGCNKREFNADSNAEDTEQEQGKKHQKDVKGRQHNQGPRGNTKPAGGDGRKKQVSNADPNAEETEQEQEAKQQLNVEGLQYADLDLRPTGKTKPAGGDGRNKLVFNDDSHVEYAEVRKV